MPEKYFIATKGPETDGYLTIGLMKLSVDSAHRMDTICSKIAELMSYWGTLEYDEVMHQKLSQEYWDNRKKIKVYDVPKESLEEGVRVLDKIPEGAIPRENSKTKYFFFTKDFYTPPYNNL